MALALVTGGSGFIGQHLVGALTARGDDVRVLDVAELPPASAPAEYVQGSVVDAAIVEEAMRGTDCVYHLAGIAHLWHRDKQAFDRINRGGTETVLKAASRAGVRRVVHCSTESILLPKRRSTGSAIDEASDPRLDEMPGPYTRSKLLAEHAARAAAREGHDVIVVNPTVPIGPGDHNNTPPAAMLALFLTGNQKFFLDCELNLVDVRDVADGIVLAGLQGRTGERYILGGENLSLQALMAILARKSGRSMPQRTVPALLALATGVVAGWWSDYVTRAPPVATLEGVVLALRSAPFDCAKARNELGYTPRPVDEALTAVVEQFKRNVADRK